ncbi:MAG TPA: toll/interleukin-1 receptor domain-containing protein [Pyrinomonadaceae bacterium]|nr:toll/interleukin-1 receptor domain-containing protein [Pyrinomonadaceae bacterium]
MSFLPNYEDDIFISYAHNDNQALLDGQRGWIDNFHQALEKRLQVHLGAKAKIWRDPRLQGNDYFADTLVEQIPRVAILVSVLSPSYVNSEWCRKEMELFCRIASDTGGVRMGNRARIFKVEKVNVPLVKLPAELQGMTGYAFYYMDEKANRPRELSPEAGPHAIEYWQKIDDVAQDITSLLEDMKNRGGVAEPSFMAQPTIQTDSSQTVIYLAETSFDLSAQYDRIKRELQERGHTVLPNRPLPLNGPALQQAVSEYLSVCKLSIHLIGENYGVIPEAADRSLVCLQNELAAERSKDESFSRLIWMPEGLQAKEERQQNFIKYLKYDQAAQQGADLLETSIEELKTYIQDKLKPTLKPTTPSSNGDDGPVRVYLICDTQDFDNIAPVEDYFYNQGFEVTLPLREGDEAEVREDHKESLLICDAVVIFYGNTSEGWLRTKLRDLQKIAGYGRTKPMLAKGIYVGGPETTSKLRYRTHEALVMRNFEQFSADTLQPFIEQIKSARKGH